MSARKVEMWLPEEFMPEPGDRLPADILRMLIADLAERAEGGAPEISTAPKKNDKPTAGTTYRERNAKWLRQFTHNATIQARYAAKELEDGRTDAAELEYWRGLASLRGAMEIGRAHSELEVKVRQVHTAKHLRKEVTHDKLIEYREKYRKKAGKERGWKTAAAIEFGISTETLRERLRSTKEN